jgi:uncharacterized protein (DUF1330 family)
VTSPKGYIYAEISVSNAVTYEEWRARVVESLNAAGGRFIIRRGDPLVLKGTTPVPLAMMIEFESRKRAQEWWRSAQGLMAFLGDAARIHVVPLSGVSD